MAIAGKVAITPGYEWSVDVAYDKLVVVTHNNNVYLSTKPSTGIEPTNEEYWMLLIENVTAEDLAELQTTVDAILNGITPVGDSNKLGGKEASKYALIDGFVPTKYRVTTTEEAEQIFDDLHANATDNELYRGYISFGVAHPVLEGSNRFVIGQRTSEYFGWQIAISYGVGNAPKNLMYRILNGGTWQQWKEVATTADLANYLSLNGGKVTADMTPIELVSTNASNDTRMKFSGTSGVLGWLGFRGANKPVFFNSSVAMYDILHTGNKPTGTYTGNGSAEQRTINTGGIGSALIIYSSNTITLVSHGGFISMDGATGAVTGGTSVYFSYGIFYCSTSIAALNASGVTYEYQVL